MKIVKLNCSSCGAPISVPDDLDHINCSACGTFLMIDRGEGYLALRAIEKISTTIEDSSRKTQDAIRENTMVTRSELERMQTHQEMVAEQTKLANLQTEIRAVQRQPKSNNQEKQIKKPAWDRI